MTEQELADKKQELRTEIKNYKRFISHSSSKAHIQIYRKYMTEIQAELKLFLDTK